MMRLSNDLFTVVLMRTAILKYPMIIPDMILF